MHVGQMKVSNILHVGSRLMDNLPHYAHLRFPFLGLMNLMKSSQYILMIGWVVNIIKSYVQVGHG